MRLRPRKRHGILTLVVLLAVAALFFIWRYTPLVADQVADVFTDNLLRDRGYRLDIDAVRADLFGRVRFTAPRLVAMREPPVVVAEAEELTAHLRLRALIAGRVDVRGLRLDKPRVRSGEGGIQGDLFRSSGRRGGPMPTIRVDDLEILGGTYEHRDSTGTRLEIEGLELQLALLADARRLQVDLGALAASIPTHGIDILASQAKLSWRDDSLHVTDARLLTDVSDVGVRGWLTRGGRSFQFEGEAAPLVLDGVSRLVAVPVSGRLQGPFEVSRHDSSFACRGEWSGRYEGLEAEAMSFDVWATPRSFHIRNASGQLAGATCQLSLRVHEEALTGDIRFAELDPARLPGMSLGLPARLEGSAHFERATARDSLRVQVSLESGRFGDWEIRRARGQIALRGSNFRLTDAVCQLPASRLTAVGGRQDGALGFEWTVETRALQEVMRPLGLQLEAGLGVVTGVTQGSVAHLQTSARGLLQEVQMGPARAGHASVDVEWSGNTGQVDLRADSLQLAGRFVERLSARLAVAASDVRVQRLEASVGDTLLAGVARWQQLPRDWLGDRFLTSRLDVETALLQIGTQEVRVEEPATLWWRHDTARVDSLRLVTREGRLRVDGQVDLQRSRIDARAEVVDFDLAFLQRVAALQHELSGTGTGWFEAHGDIDRTQIDARLVLQNGSWNDLPFDSLRVELQSDPFGSELRALRCVSPQGTVAASGRLGYLPGLRRWLRGAPGSRSPSDLSRAPVQLSCVVRDLEVDRVWGARAAGAPEPAWSARVSARLDVTGTVEAPHVVLAGSAQDLRLPRSNAEAVTFDLEFADEEFRVPRFEVLMGGATIHAEGTLPARLHLAHGASLYRDRPFETHVRVPRSPFALVQQLIPLFEAAPQSVPAGEIEATLDVTGTMSAPVSRGGLRVEGAGFTLQGMEEIYRNVYAEGEFAADSLRIKSIRADVGDKGTVRGSGSVYFDGFRLRDYRFSLQANQVQVESVPQMVAEVGGNVEMRAVRLGGRPVPEFQGALRVVEATITQEFGSNTGDTGVLESTDAPDWLADLTLDAPGKVWIKNSQADLELEGSVRVVRSTSGMDVSGRATIRRGNYSLYLERFEITRGELDFSRHPGFQPELDIEARQGRPGNRIYVHLAGRPPDNLRWSLSSDRGETSDELQQILFAGVRNDPFNISSTVVERIVQDLQFIESFSIDQAGGDSTSTNNIPFNISAGKKLSDRVFVIYTVGLNESDLRDRVALEVDITRGVLLESSYERRNIPDFQPNRAQNAFDIDLKFRWEY